MSHVRTLDPATSENLYAADERRSGIRTTIYHDVASGSQIQAWPPNSPMDELTSTSHAYSGYPYQDHNSTSNFSSIDSYGGFANFEGDQRLAGSSNAAPQAEPLVDTTSGTQEPRGYYNDLLSPWESQELGHVDSHGYVTHQIPPWESQEPELPQIPSWELPQELKSPYPHFDSDLSYMDYVPLPCPPSERVLEYVDQDFIPLHTYQGGDSSSAVGQDGEFDLKPIPSSTLIATLIDRPNLCVPMRRSPDISARDVSSLTQPSSAVIGESGTQLDTQSHHPASLPVAMRCPHCHVEFTGIHRNGNLGRHVRQKHNKPREYVCEELWCGRVFLRADARLKHYRKRHPEIVRDTVASQPDDGRNRREYHTNGTDGTRDKGLGLVNTMSAMSSRERHSNVDSASSMLTTLTRGPSVETTHKTEESLQCSDCHKTFNRLADLRRHKAGVHDPDPPKYLCTIPGCPRASHGFPRKDKLNNHMAKMHGPSTTAKHLKPTTFACPEQGCAREFDQRADLLRHQRTHTDMSERPHQCGQCDKSFLYPKDLKRHEATHLGDQDDEKPSFHCPVTSCEYGPGGSGFSRKDGMLRHMKRFHPEWKEEKEGV